jgi:enhancing lycopene biosynthesis protein 2
MIKIGVVLSGCGVEDGSEIYESVLTLLALEKAGATAVALAPDTEQAQVINHYTGQETRLETRHVLTESARIVRGKITSISEITAHDIDGVIFVGGYGAAKNLCTYANDGIEATVNPDVEQLILDLISLGKPVGAMCIASVVVALSLRGRENAVPPTLTVGEGGNAVVHLQQLGAKHQTTAVDQICIDEHNKIISTAAFMLAESAAEAEPGITKLVDHLVSMVRETNATYQG